MRVAYVDSYDFGSLVLLHKDPVTIPKALKCLGVDIFLISTENNQKENELYGLPIMNLEDVSRLGWENHGFDHVVFVSRLDGRHTNDIEKIKASGLPLVIKCDSDGTWGFPIPPNYLRARHLLVSPLNIFRHIKWKAPFKYYLKEKFKQVKLADSIILESPAAVVNAATVLTHWGLKDQIQKLKFIPNPVSPAVESMKINIERKNLLVVAGRWDDAEVKSTKVMLSVISSFMATNKDFQVDVVGSGLKAKDVEMYLEKFMRNGQVIISGSVSFEDLQVRLGAAKVVLVTSKLESFCFVAAEALCAGASLVATPIESMAYFVGGGKWGICARGFDRDSILVALACELSCWRSGQRDSMRISRFWRSELNGEGVARLYKELICNHGL